MQTKKNIREKRTHYAGNHENRVNLRPQSEERVESQRTMAHAAKLRRKEWSGSCQNIETHTQYSRTLDKTVQ